jgi:transposase InsO family protein
MDIPQNRGGMRWTVSENTVADSMRRQGLQGRKPKRRKGTTKQDKTAPKFPDRLRRDFTAPEANVKWCGDMTDIPTAHPCRSRRGRPVRRWARPHRP